ncbi:sigma factor [Nocardia arthritidis]|nr:sigma factor [Nocardia arthritidis]
MRIERGLVVERIAVPAPGDAGAGGRLRMLPAEAGSGELDRPTSPPVFEPAVRILRDRAMAEEVTQEVYLRVWSAAERYEKQWCGGPIGLVGECADA